MGHFTAAWCMPSVAMNPFFEELAANFQGVSFLTIDVDEVQVINNNTSFCFFSRMKRICTDSPCFRPSSLGGGI